MISFKSIFQYSALLLMLLSFLSPNLQAQNYNENDEVLQTAQKIVLKKIRVDLDKVDQFREDKEFAFSNTVSGIRSAGSEIQVTNHSYAESEVHAVINPKDSNNIILCPIRMRTGQGYSLPVYYTRDFGKTWDQSTFIPRPRDTNSTVIGGGDPVFAFDADGKLYFTWISLYRLDSYYWWELLWAYSNDGGETWSKSSSDYISSSFGTSFYPLNITEIADKQWMATDKSGSAYKNNLYVAYLLADIPKNTTQIMLSRKKAGVDSFDDRIAISGSNFKEVQFACVSVDPYGYVHISFYGSLDKSNYYLWHSISKDGGSTFSAPQQVSKLVKMTKLFGISDSRLYPAPYMEIDQSESMYKGYVYLTWTSTGISSNNGNGADIYLSVSSDTGQTWSTPIVVNNDPRGKYRDQFYSSLYVNPDGVLSLAWCDARHSADSLNKIVHLTLTHSFDGGKTFTENFNVTSQFSNFQTIGSQNNNFGIGEYNQLLSTKGYVIPVWSDGRKGDGNLDIYVAFAEISKNPVSVNEVSTISADVILHDVFPIPAKKDIFASFTLQKSSFVNFQVFSTDGKKVAAFEPGMMMKGEHKVKISIDNLEPGVYILSMITDHDLFTRSFTVKK